MNNKNKTKKSNTKRISRTEAVKLINNSKGRFFTVTFVKNNGNTRTINGSRKNQTPLGNITMYSAKDKGYRTVNPNTIKSLSINDTMYVVS